jgi:hypothetical protein
MARWLKIDEFHGSVFVSPVSKSKTMSAAAHALRGGCRNTWRPPHETICNPGLGRHINECRCVCVGEKSSSRSVNRAPRKSDKLV